MLTVYEVVMQKRYIVLIVISVLVCGLIWKISSSYAIFDPGYDGENIVSGDKWGVNIVEVSEIESIGSPVINEEISTIGTTLNFGVSLFAPGDMVTFDFTVKNTGKLDAELYATTLSGLSNLESEVISYEVLPLDYATIHEDKNEGSIIKSGESQMFRITVKYEDNVAITNIKEYNLGLGSTIIYKQK